MASATNLIFRAFCVAHQMFSNNSFFPNWFFLTLFRAVPSLVSIPILGYDGYDRAAYEATRQRLLNSKTNRWKLSSGADKHKQLVLIMADSHSVWSCMQGHAVTRCPLFHCVQFLL